jgi:hypothetical protein
MNVKFMGREVCVDLVNGRLLVGDVSVSAPAEHELRSVVQVGSRIRVELVRREWGRENVLTRYFDGVSPAYQEVFHPEGQLKRVPFYNRGRRRGRKIA